MRTDARALDVFFLPPGLASAIRAGPAVPSVRVLCCTKIVQGWSVAVAISNAELEEQLVKDLAFVKGLSVVDMQALLAEHGGDLEIKSKEGQAVAARIEAFLDVENLIHPEDQKPENLTTFKSLATLIFKRVAEAGLGAE